MISSTASNGRRSSEYRRGTVMGLTIAEVLVLLAFILLLLITLWHATERKRYQNLHDRLSVSEFLERCQPEEVAWLKETVTSGALSQTIALSKAIEQGARLVENEEAKRLLNYAQSLSQDEQQAFLELVRDEKVIDVVDIAKSIKKGARLVKDQGLKKVVEHLDQLPNDQKTLLSELIVSNPQKLAKWTQKIDTLIKQGYKPKQITQAFDLIDLLSQEELQDINSLKQKIRQHIQGGEMLGREVASAISRVVGDLVETIGGEIDPNTGAVTLPDTALFSQGSATLSDQTVTFLNRFCEPWLKSLEPFGDQIGALKIEGHASTEWGNNVSTGEAFVRNMDLSQKRASAVFEYCINRLSDQKQRKWAQSRLVAVGYSSAKPIFDNGREDSDRSRRVVFRTEVDNAQILKDINREISSSDNIKTDAL